MKKSILAFLLIVFCDVLTGSAKVNQEYYQLKIYSFETNEQLQVTETFLENAYLPALKRMAVKNIGVFKPRPENDAPMQIFVLIPFKSLEQINDIEVTLKKDKKFNIAGKEYLKAPHDNAPYSRIESVVLKAFKNMPLMKPSRLTGPRKDRIYELRSYESATEAYLERKIEMFNDGGEIEIFNKYRFNAVFYAEVISGSKMPNLMYMTTHENKTQQDQNWNNFRKSPEWSELKVKKKYANTVSHIDKWFLFPTEYSDY